MWIVDEVHKSKSKSKNIRKDGCLMKHYTDTSKVPTYLGRYLAELLELRYFVDLRYN